VTLDERNAIFIRLYRHIFVIQYFYDNVLSLPDGFFNGGFKADLSTLGGSWYTRDSVSYFISENILEDS